MTEYLSWLGYALNLILGVLLGVVWSFLYFRRIGPGLMWKAACELPLHKAAINFTMQRKATGCAMVFWINDLQDQIPISPEDAKKEGLLVAIAMDPKVPEAEAIEFEKAAASCLVSFVRLKEIDRAKEQAAGMH